MKRPSRSTLKAPGDSLGRTSGSGGGGRHTDSGGDEAIDHLIKEHLELIRLVREGKVTTSSLEEPASRPNLASLPSYSEPRPAESGRDSSGTGTASAKKRRGLLRARLERGRQKYMAALKQIEAAQLKLEAARRGTGEATRRQQSVRLEGMPWPARESEGRRLLSEMRAVEADLGRFQQEAQWWESQSHWWDREAQAAAQEINRWYATLRSLPASDRSEIG